MDILKFPLSFDNDGSMSKLRENSDGFFKQLISFCILTEPASLPLTPDFGVYDPTFSRVSPEKLALSASKFIPEVQIQSLGGTISSNDGTISVKFVYNR
jgi:hypothetical protein